MGVAVVALPFLFWMIFALLKSYTHHNDFVLVPDFKDLKLQQLETFISDKKINYEIIDSIWDPKLQKGIVVKQDPDPGEKVKEGRKVYLYVTSVRPPMINMPKLEDLSLRQAMAVCESYGLICVAQGVDDPCDGCIVKQLYREKRIEPGTLIEKGQTIKLMYGKGENNSGQGFDVPNLVGLTFRAARGKMVDKGLEWLLVADPGVKDTLNAFVYSQEPKPGRDRKLITGAMIDLRVTNDKSKLSGDSIK